MSRGAGEMKVSDNAVAEYCSRIFQIRKTCWSMLADRGFEVAPRPRGASTARPLVCSRVTALGMPVGTLSTGVFPCRVCHSRGVQQGYGPCRGLQERRCMGTRFGGSL